MSVPPPQALAQDEPTPQVDIDLGGLSDLLENEVILDYIEACQTGDGVAPAVDPDVAPVTLGNAIMWIREQLG